MLRQHSQAWVRSLGVGADAQTLMGCTRRVGDVHSKVSRVVHGGRWHPVRLARQAQRPSLPPITFWMTSSSQLDRSIEGSFLASSICWEFRMLLTSKDIPSLLSLGILRTMERGEGMMGV